MYYDHDGDMMGGWGVGWLMMGIFWLLIVALLVIGILYVVRMRELGGAHSSIARAAPPSADALAILDTRLAKGEIDVATYDELRAKLTQSR